MKIKDQSIGIVPIFKDSAGENLFLVVLHKAGHWAFPKGHKKAGENDSDTATRELYEESGIRYVKLENHKEFLEYYSFEKNGKKYDKKVKYFIGFVKDTNIDQPEEFKKEIPETRFVNYEEALELMTYDESKNLLKKVRDYLENLKIKKLEI